MKNKHLSCKTITAILALLMLITGFVSYVKAGGDMGFIKASIFGDAEMPNENNLKPIFFTKENVDQFLYPEELKKENKNTVQELYIMTAKKREIEF